MRLPRTVGVVLALGFLGAAPRAFGEQLTPEQRETARFHMQEGRALRDKGDLHGALQKFKAADAIVHAPTSGLEVARTYASLGMLVEARDAALHVVRIPEQADEASVYKTARTAAGKLSEDLAGTIPTLAIAAKDGGKSAVPILTKVDDVELATPAGVTIVPRRVNPGAHVVYARTADKEGSERVEVKVGEVKQVVVALHPGAPPLPPPPPPPQAAVAPAVRSPPPPAREPPPPPPSGLVGNKTVTFAAFGVAGVGALVGSITGVVALGHASDARKACQGSTCLASSSSDFDAAHSFATASTISFVVAGVALALGIANLVVGTPSAQVGFRRSGLEGTF
jgi:hypothetical protein